MNRQIAESIIAWVSKETNVPLTFQGITEGGAIRCLNKRGRQHVIVCYGTGPGWTIVKSLLYVKRRGSYASWLINGQASRNMGEVVFWNESHKYYFTVEEYVNYARELHDGKDYWLELLRQGTLRPPLHLSLEAIENYVRENPLAVLQPV